MKYRFIDSIRGIAILLVVLVHSSQSLLLPDSLLKAAYFGQMGVQLFFVASAYTLCLSYNARRGESHALMAFFIRRFFRIAPIYYVGIAFYWCFRTWLNNGSPDQYTATNIAANVFLIHGLYEPANNNIVPGGWSIGAEVLFYAMFPWLLPALEKPFKRYAAVCILLPISILAITSTSLRLANIDVSNGSFGYFSIWNQLSVFVLGIGLYHLHHHHRHIMSGIGTETLVVAGFALASITAALGWLYDIRHSFTLVPFMSGLAFCCLITVFQRVDKLNWPLLQHIGQRSYSIYLIHFVFAWTLSGWLNTHFLVERAGTGLAFFSVFMASMVSSYTIAGVTYHHIEGPCIRLGSRFIKTLQTVEKRLTA